MIFGCEALLVWQKKLIRIDFAHFVCIYKVFRLAGSSGVANHGIRIDLEKFS